MSKTPKEIWCRSGLYYEYVKDWSEGSWSPTNDGGVKYVRADHIKELEEENAQLKAQLAKAVEALRFLKSEIRGHGFSDEGRMLVKCNSTLEQLTGGKDE